MGKKKKQSSIYTIIATGPLSFRGQRGIEETDNKIEENEIINLGNGLKQYYLKTNQNTITTKSLSFRKAKVHCEN